MDIISVIIVLIVIGALLYVVNRLAIDATIKMIIQVVVIVAVAIWLLRGFAPQLHLGRFGGCHAQTITETYKEAA